MDKFTESASSYNAACGPSRFQHRVLYENLQAAQAQRANHQNEEALDHLSLFNFNSQQQQPQVGNMAQVQGMKMQATGDDKLVFFHQTQRPMPVIDSKKEAADQLAVLNHYKEKSIKLQIELAKLQRKYDVLNEKLDKFSGIEASIKVTIADCEFRTGELMKQNLQLKSELAQWKDNWFLMQQQGIPVVKPIPPIKNNAHFYLDPQPIQMDDSPRPKVVFGGQKTIYYADN